jgi:trimeric autotransporter adhesin
MGSFRPALRPGALAAGLVLLLGAPADAQSNILLQLESGSPAGGRFVVDSAGGFVAQGAFGQGTIPATGGGGRLMWHSGKRAFRAGFVTSTQWNDVNVGNYSVATGSNTTASALSSTAMGAGSTASGDYSTAMGYSVTASGNTSTAMGMSTTASGVGSIAMGRDTRASGVASMAMGYRASTQEYSGSFVYGDASTSDTVRSSAAHQATWRTIGGFRIFTNTALTNGCSIAGGGTAWSCTSSRLEKENFAAVDGEDVLRRLRAVPVTSWNGIAAGTEVRHIGPMAQDWHAAFALNDDPLTIHQGDMAGVSLAAVQALDERTRGMPEVERELARLREENAGLRADAAALRMDATALRTEAAALRARAAEQDTRLERLEALVASPTAEP